MLLALVMVIGLAACGAKEEPKAEAPATDGPVADAPVTDAPAADEPVKLRLVLYGEGSTRRDEYFENEFHDRVLEELNIDFTLEWLPWSEMNGPVITNMLASGEAFAFENITTLNDFHTKGFVAEITEDQIQANMPNYLDMRGPNNGFDCISYQGKIYGIPIGEKPYAGHHQAILVRNDLLNEVGYDASDLVDIASLEKALLAVKEKHPDYSVFYGDQSKLSSLAGQLVPGTNVGEVPKGTLAYVNEAESGDTVHSFFESDLFKEYCLMQERWVELGLQGEDILTDPGKVIADWDAGNCIARYATGLATIEFTSNPNFTNDDLKNVKFGDFPFVKVRDYDWGISVSAADAGNIEHWLRLIDWMYSSEEVFNFCVYGVEGKDWEYNEDGTINKLTDALFWDDWFINCSKYIKYDPAISEETIKLYESSDNGSILSKAAGFTFDPTPVETEVALLSAVVTEYFEPMLAGFFSYEENYEDALAALKDAGIDAYMAEYQAQFSAWYANK